MAEVRRLLKVLISSKQSEFVEERADIVQLMTPMPLLAVNTAEHWGPESTAVEEKSVKEAAECSVYVGLFGALYSEPTILEYGEAAKNDYREMLIYVKECKERDPRLAGFIASLGDPKHGHTLSIYSDWKQIRNRFVDHLWTAVARMIDHLIQLGNPPKALGDLPVFQRRWLQQKQLLTALGLPDSPEEARFQAAYLSERVRLRM